MIQRKDSHAHVPIPYLLFACTHGVQSETMTDSDTVVNLLWQHKKNLLPVIMNGVSCTYELPIYPGGHKHCPSDTRQVAPFWHVQVPVQYAPQLPGLHASEQLKKSKSQHRKKTATERVLANNQSVIRMPGRQNLMISHYSTVRPHGTAWFCEYVT